MSSKINVKFNQLPCYDIYLQDNFDDLWDRLVAIIDKRRKVCVVSDSRVANIYQKDIEFQIGGKCEKLIFFIFPEGEASKNTATIGKLYETLIRSQFDRSDILIALGGGVVGDMTGFAAATYLRGIDFIQIPTTLLSQVDSSIGGKTGVDHMGYKNMVGAFKMPKLVYMNLSVLNTLSREQFSSGMAEVIKHGLIKDASYYEYIRDNAEPIKALSHEHIEHIVEGSCNIKREVVEKDPEEKGERALLNFGHTIGHAIEKLSDFKLFHGQCVAIGMVAAAYISHKRGYITEYELHDLTNLLEQFELPIRVPADFSMKIEDIIDATKNDKKRSGSKIKFILLKNIGSAIIDTTVSDEEIKEGIGYIL